MRFCIKIDALFPTALREARFMGNLTLSGVFATEGALQMLKNTKVLTGVKKIADKELSRNANSTSCTWIYQPKAPEALKRFSKIENDK